MENNKKKLIYNESEDPSMYYHGEVEGEEEYSLFLSSCNLVVGHPIGMFGSNKILDNLNAVIEKYPEILKKMDYDGFKDAFEKELSQKSEYENDAEIYFSSEFVETLYETQSIVAKVIESNYDLLEDNRWGC